MPWNYKETPHLQYSQVLRKLLHRSWVKGFGESPKELSSVLEPSLGKVSFVQGTKELRTPKAL